MRLQFDKNQAYQLEAIRSVVDLFEGQPYQQFPAVDFAGQDVASGDFAQQNKLVLSKEEIAENLIKVQRRNGLDDDGGSALKELSYMDTMAGQERRIAAPFPNFSIEMETGTGKTYVYLRTIYELNKAYGFKKFVIVVPSVAIREGVLKTLQITFEHFQELYKNEPAGYGVYDSGRITELVNFAKGDAIRILVINIDSFTKDANIINQVQETGVKPIEYIRNIRPILIIDEPQNVETDIRKKAIANLNPLLALRYSATHKNPYNLVYRLDPVKAYDLGLVKQIEVDSVVSWHESPGAFVSLDSLRTGGQSITSRITIFVNEKSGIQKKRITAKVGDDLYQHSKQLEVYKNGFVINEIDADDGCIVFSGGKVVRKGQATGGLTDHVLKEMIDATVENHFRKEKELKPKGIKVLSVFFVDRVSNYRSYDEEGNVVQGKFAKWFEESFVKWQNKSGFQHLYPYRAHEVHDGYFSQDKGRFKDSREGRPTRADDETFRLIMRDKERLLSNDTPLRFIFSHSALREGWDNPNVFQICTLSETKSELKKRQEIGRGLRLCVDQNGIRNQERPVNRLTIIANESYESFSKALQTELQQDCGVPFEGRIRNAREKTNLKLRKQWMSDPHFIELWQTIRHRTGYRVSYCTEELIRNSTAAIEGMKPIAPPEIERVKYQADFVRNEKGRLKKIDGLQAESRRSRIDHIIYEIPDCISFIQQQTGLTRKTVIQILTASNRLKEIFYNPQVFMDTVAGLIKRELNLLSFNHIIYEQAKGKTYDAKMFEEEEREHYTENLVEIKNPRKTIAPYVPVNPLNPNEKRFATECDENEEVVFYVKLPHAFTIDTPGGGYHPDWALIKKDGVTGKKTCFVVDTKVSSANNGKHRELLKTRCAKKHFDALKGISYHVGFSVSELKI